MRGGRALARALRGAAGAASPGDSASPSLARATIGIGAGARTTARLGGEALGATRGARAFASPTARASLPRLASAPSASRRRSAGSIPRGARGGALLAPSFALDPRAARSAVVAASLSQARRASGGGGVGSFFGFGGKKPGDEAGASSPSAGASPSADASSAGSDAVASSSADAVSSSLAAAAPAAASEVAAVAGDSWMTTSALMYAIEYFHVAHGLEWWLAIVATTTLMRGVTIPLTVMQQRNAARLHAAKPEIEAINRLAKENAHDQKEMQRYQAEILKVWAKHDCNPVKMFAPLFVQAPVFISFFFAIRNMSVGVPSFREGGALWFRDLSVADPTYVLPLLSSLTFLASVELNPPNPQQNTPAMKWGMRGLAAAMVPLTASFPQGVFVYWVTTNAFSFAQGRALKVPALKALAGIPDVPDVSEHAAAGASQRRAIEERFGAEPKLATHNPKVREGASDEASARETSRETRARRRERRARDVARDARETSRETRARRRERRARDVARDARSPSSLARPAPPRLFFIFFPALFPALFPARLSSALSNARRE
jgi:YidC/Oxa1 family membrane protein insertase